MQNNVIGTTQWVWKQAKFFFIILYLSLFELFFSKEKFMKYSNLNYTIVSFYAKYFKDQWKNEPLPHIQRCQLFVIWKKKKNFHNDEISLESQIWDNMAQ